MLEALTESRNVCSSSVCSMCLSICTDVVPNVMLVSKGKDKDEQIPKLPLKLTPQVFIGCCISGLNTSQFVLVENCATCKNGKKTVLFPQPSVPAVFRLCSLGSSQHFIVAHSCDSREEKHPIPTCKSVQYLQILSHLRIIKLGLSIISNLYCYYYIKYEVSQIQVPLCYCYLFPESLNGNRVYQFELKH